LDPFHWEQVVSGRGFFVSLDYLKALENASIAGLSFRYVILYRANEPVAVFCFQAVDLSDEGLGGVLNLDQYGGLSSAIAATINGLLFKSNEQGKPTVLVCGSLLSSGEYGMVAIDDNSLLLAGSHFQKVKNSVLESLKGSRIVAEMIKDFYSYNGNLMHWFLPGMGFPLRTDPEMILDLNPEWRSFEDYLAALSSKYRVRANAVRRSLEGVQEQVLSEKNLLDHQVVIRGLFQEVFAKAPIRLVNPGFEYIHALKRQLGDRFVITGYMLRGELIAFRTAIIHGGVLEAHYIGLNYGLNRELDLYQNILYGLIDDAISHRCVKVYYGRTALEIKSVVGAKPHALQCYMRFNNKVLNTVTKAIVGSLGPKDWIQRNPFKE
jgi:hypothetical protein